VNSYNERLQICPDLESVYGKSFDLHVAQTLARSYYINQSTTERDLDQVVLKQCKELNRQKSNEKNNAESQQHRSGHPEKPRPISGTITGAAQPANPDVDGQPVSFSHPQVLQPKSEADPKRQEGIPHWEPIVSLLMVHHLWLWKIDNRKHKEPSFVQ